MNIGIDARLLERRITGIGRVLITFLNDIPKFDNENRYFLFSYGPIDCDKDFYKISLQLKVSFPKNCLPQSGIILFCLVICKKTTLTYYFLLIKFLPLVKVKNCKYVSIVHDVIYKADPNFLPFIYRKYLQFFAYFSIKISDRILTDSEYSKKDILKHYNVPENKIKVVLPATNKDFKPLNFTQSEKEEIKKQFGLIKICCSIRWND